MYYWGKEPNKTLIECDKCDRILKFDDKYFSSHSDCYCISNCELTCICGNKVNGKIDSKDKEIAEYKKSNHSSSSVPKCPYCGSTNIQLIRKKWSLLTGFLTNQVERYCVNCKKKF